MLGKTYVWLRLLRRQSYHWMILAIATCKVIYLCGTQQDREKARLQIALARIDFAFVYAFMNDLLW